MASPEITPCNDLATLHVGVANCLGDDWDYFREALKTGECQGWRINNNSFAITRVERDNKNRLTLVVCCYEGKDVKGFAVYITQWARLKGFKIIRFHTAHKGLHRLIEPVNAAYIESIYEVDLHEPFK